MTESQYLLDNRHVEAGDRLGALAALFDPVTAGHFDALGVGAGWRCLEVGAGGGSVARHLSERVGPTGRVLATDIEPHFLVPLVDLGNVDVARHDVVVDPLPEAAFDLVHTRFVLLFIPERLAVLHRLAETVRPGGWLLVEDLDGIVTAQLCLDPQTDDDHLANRIRRGMLQLVEQRGGDVNFGRSLVRLLRTEGLVDLGGDGYVATCSATARTLERANALQLKDMFLEAGTLTQEEFDRYLARLDDPDFTLASPMMLSAWGRRPA